MSGTTLRMLLVGTSEAEFSSVKEHLLKLDWSCEFVQSCSDGGMSAAQGSFDVILCKADLKDYQAMFAAVLRPSGCVFRCFPVEDSCWWVPPFRKIGLGFCGNSQIAGAGHKLD